MSTTPSALDGVLAKISRARIHMTDLQERLDSVLGPNHQEFRLQKDPESDKHELRVYGVPPIDPEWTLIVGDCLHNLRSAMDHLAWQLVLLDGGKPIEGRTQFPIRDSPLDQKGNRVGAPTTPPIKRKDIRDAIEAVQPYNGQGINTPVESHHLWMLKTLNNIDKHRLLLFIVFALDAGSMWWGLNEGDPSPKAEFNMSVIQEGSPVAWFDFGGAEPPANFDPHPSIQVTLNEAAVLNLIRLHLHHALDLLIHGVEFDVSYDFMQLFS